MEFPNFSQASPCSSAAVYRDQYPLVEFCATSSDKRKLRIDRAYYVHRRQFDNYPVLLFHYAGPVGSPDLQAEYFLSVVSPLTELDMILLEIDSSSGLMDPAQFVTRWARHIESRTGKRICVQVTSHLSHVLTRAVTQDRVVKAPRYGGYRASWPHDIHQYSVNRNRTNLDLSALLERCNK